MPLILHLFKKDLRRTYLLMAFWVLLVAVQYAVMAWSLRPGDHLAQTVYTTICDVSPTLQALVLAVLVALLVQEEPPAGTTGFWLTRPLSRSAVLRTKAIFALILLAVPALAEIVVLTAGGVTRHDIALAVPEVVLGQLQVMLAAAVLAAVTPNFARFAIAGAVAWVGLYLVALGINWLPNYLGRNRDDVVENAMTLWHSRTIAYDILIAVGLGTAFVYQYRTRRTAGAIAIAVIAELGGVAITNTWTKDFFPPEAAPPATVKLDSAAIWTTLTETHLQDQPDFRRSGPLKKSVSGVLYVGGLPEGYVALPRKLLPRLSEADGHAIEVKQARSGYYVFEPNPQLFEPALGKAFVYGRPGSPYSTEVSAGLFMLSAENFRSHAEQRLTFSTDIDFELDQYVLASRMAAAKGAHADRGSEHEFITDVLQEGDGVAVILERRYMNLLFSRPNGPNQADNFPVSFGYSADNKTYLLFNRRNREAVVARMNDGVNQISSPRPDSRLAHETLQVSFGSDNWSLTPKLNAAWLADAELIELTRKPAAEFTQSLTVNNFILDASNRSARLPPPLPLSDPQWLTRFSLPEHATKAQMRDYVDDIVAASAYWRSDSGSELPVAMLAKVGPGNVDILLGALDRASGSYQGVGPLQTAILRTAGPADKASIVLALPDHPGFVDLVVKFHWEADCRDTLIAALRDTQKTSLPRNWIVAVASLEDPSTYPDLRAYLVRTHARQATYNAIRKLPEIDLRATVDASWKQAQSGSHAELTDAAAMAVDVGYPDALKVLIDVLRQDDVSQPTQIERAGTLVKRYTPATGDNADLVAWYDANRDRLTFDPRKKKFLPGQ